MTESTCHIHARASPIRGPTSRWKAICESADLNDVGRTSKLRSSPRPLFCHTIRRTNESLSRSCTTQGYGHIRIAIGVHITDRISTSHNIPSEQFSDLVSLPCIIPEPSARISTTPTDAVSLLARNTDVTQCTPNGEAVVLKMTTSRVRGPQILGGQQWGLHCSSHMLGSEKKCVFSYCWCSGEPSIERWMRSKLGSHHLMIFRQDLCFPQLFHS